MKVRDYETPTQANERRKRPLKKWLCKECAKKFGLYSMGSPWIATQRSEEENL